MIKYLAIFCLFAFPAFAWDGDDNNAMWALQEAKFQANKANSNVRNNHVYSDDSSIRNLVTKVAIKHNVPTRIAHAIVKVESGYRCNARSRSGAVGIMQTLPATARDEGITGRLTDCATGLEAGMRYLSRIVRSYGTGCAAMSLYERGIYAIPRCSGYGQKVVRLAAN